MRRLSCCSFKVNPEKIGWHVNKFHAKIWLSGTKVRGLCSALKCNLVHFTSFADDCFTMQHLGTNSGGRVLMNKPKVKLRLYRRTALLIYHTLHIGLILLLFTFLRCLKCLAHLFFFFPSTKYSFFKGKVQILGYRIDTSCAV